MAYQLSIFLENKPGRLDNVTGVLSDNNINIRYISVASQGEFGVAKILVNKPDEAFEILKKNHCTVSMQKIIIVEIQDKPGSLHDLLSAFTSNNVNIRDCYGFLVEENRKAVVVIEVDKIPQSNDIIKEHNIKILSDKEIYSV